MPFTLGGILAWFLSGSDTFFTPDVATWEIMLFVGASMSITAFPMLARIIYERGLTAIVTTLMASPLFELVRPTRPVKVTIPAGVEGVRG